MLRGMELSARRETLVLAQTFRIARETQDTADVVQVAVRQGGLTGYGEAAPVDRYEESVESGLAWLEEAAAGIGDDPWALDEIAGRLPPGEYAARAALDAALHDLCAKQAASRSIGC